MYIIGKILFFITIFLILFLNIVPIATTSSIPVPKVKLQCDINQSFLESSLNESDSTFLLEKTDNQYKGEINYILKFFIKDDIITIMAIPFSIQQLAIALPQLQKLCVDDITPVLDRLDFDPTILNSGGYLFSKKIPPGETPIVEVDGYKYRLLYGLENGWGLGIKVKESNFLDLFNISVPLYIILIVVVSFGIVFVLHKRK